MPVPVGGPTLQATASSALSHRKNVVRTRAAQHRGAAAPAAGAQRARTQTAPAAPQRRRGQDASQPRSSHSRAAAAWDAAPRAGRQQRGTSAAAGVRSAHAAVAAPAHEPQKGASARGNTRRRKRSANDALARRSCALQSLQPPHPSATAAVGRAPAPKARVQRRRKRAGPPSDAAPLSPSASAAFCAPRARRLSAQLCCHRRRRRRGTEWRCAPAARK